MLKTMSTVFLERENLESQEKLRLTHEPAPINLHIYQPPRLLRVDYQNQTRTVFDITGEGAGRVGFNQKITEESYRPLIEEGILGSDEISWNLYGVTADWMEKFHPELISTLRSQIDQGASPPVGDTYLHIIFPFLSNDHKNMLMEISKRSYKERWGADMETVWLPESAVDEATVTCLVQNRIKGVHLREHQVKTSNRNNVQSISSTSGEILAIIGHNELSGVIGFDKPWADAFFYKWQKESRDRGYSPRLSIDGETLGHWWKKDEGAFAFTKYLLKYLNEGINGSHIDHSLTKNIPKAEIVNNTSWSCIDDGVGRWKGNEACHCALPKDYHDAQRVRSSKKDLFNKLSTASERIDDSLDNYLPGWREVYVEWFMSQRSKLATGQAISAKMFKDPTIEKLFLSAYTRDLGWTSCGWFFGDVNGFERQIPANSLSAIASINGWADIIPTK